MSSRNLVHRKRYLEVLETVPPGLAKQVVQPIDQQLAGVISGYLALAQPAGGETVGNFGILVQHRLEIGRGIQHASHDDVAMLSKCSRSPISASSPMLEPGIALMGAKVSKPARFHSLSRPLPESARHPADHNGAGPRGSAIVPQETASLLHEPTPAILHMRGHDLKAFLPARLTLVGAPRKQPGRGLCSGQRL